MASTSPKADNSGRKRRNWSLSAENHDMVCRHASAAGMSDNAALNALLFELREWRDGKRRFVDPTQRAAAGAR